MMTNEVTTTETNALTNGHTAMAAHEDILTSDIMLPKILLQQNTSVMVNAEEAKPGDFVNSITKEKYGDAKNPIEIVPLTFRNLWTLKEWDGKNYQWKGVEDRTAMNENASFEFDVDGEKWRRFRTLELYCLYVDGKKAAKVDPDAFAPDLSNVVVPHVISLTSTQFTKTGRKVLSHFNNAKAMGVEAFRYKLKFSHEKTKNDDGTWNTWVLEPGAKPCPELFDDAKKWYNVIFAQAQKFSVHAGDEETATQEVDTKVEGADF